MAKNVVEPYIVSASTHEFLQFSIYKNKKKVAEDFAYI